MRQERIRGEGTSYYHCISRVVDRRFILGDGEREHFVALMRKLEAFHGMRVVTYCVMSNHFHLLIEEPDQEVVKNLDSESILKRIGFLYDSTTVRSVGEELKRAKDSNNLQWEEEILDRYRGRMGDLACFMKELTKKNRDTKNRDRLNVGFLRSYFCIFNKFNVFQNSAEWFTSISESDPQFSDACRWDFHL